MLASFRPQFRGALAFALVCVAGGCGSHGADASPNGTPPPRPSSGGAAGVTATSGASGTTSSAGHSAGASGGAAGVASGGRTAGNTGTGAGGAAAAGGRPTGTGGSATAGGTATASGAGGIATGVAGKDGDAGAAGESTGTGATTCGASTGPVSVTDLAFPEAEGFGRHATGGRDGSVYHVTNLNDAGAGSFRDAVSQPNRIVVFDVGGYVALATAVSVKSNITIAGQTAPGGGIGFRGGEISFANSSNIVCRFVRIRPGSDTASTEDDALSLYLARNVIVDHASLEFAPWNDIDGVSDDWQNHPVTDVTFQDSLIADPTGQQFGAHTESVSSQWSWYRNVFANSHNRNPLAKVNTVFVNNVLYNYSAGYTTHTSTSFEHDIVNNAFVFGPASTGTDNTWFQIDKNQSIYDSGNVEDSNLNGAFDGAATSPSWYQGTGTVLASPWSSVSSTPYTAASAYRIAVSQAGALPRDPVDALVIAQVRTLGKGTTGTGAGTVGPSGSLYTSQSETGLSNDGYGDIATGAKPDDSDEDGMPDFWERATGSDLAADDAMQKAPDGYALIEHYLDWLAVPHAVSTAGSSVDIDLSDLTLGFSDVSPTFSVSTPSCGTVTLADGHIAHFTPASGDHGVSSFDFTVQASDATTYTGHVLVAVVP